MYLPDPFKIEVLKFLDTPAGKALLVAAHERLPAQPDANLPHSTKLSMYDQRAGAEFMLAELRKIPHESQPKSTNEKEANPLLDPRD